MTARQEILQKVGAIKGVNGWSDTDLARKLGCSRGTVANIKKDPGMVQYKTILRLEKLYRKECES